MTNRMRARDRYSSFPELTRHVQEGVDYQRHILDRASMVAIVAPHGGGIEPGTSEIALALAGKDFSVYCFEALRPENCDTLHLTSHRFDDPACLKLLGNAQVAVGVHGCGGRHPAVQVGGRHVEFKQRLVAGLSAAGFSAHEDIQRNPGLHPHNVCNRAARGEGVQIELSEGLRKQMFAGLTRAQRQVTTPVFAHFIHSLHKILCEMEANHA